MGCDIWGFGHGSARVFEVSGVYLGFAEEVEGWMLDGAQPWDVCSLAHARGM